MRFRLALAAVAILASGAASAADRPVVVELFTSQGCSSCPPADALLTDLARDRTGVLPLAFHVTYWNDLGWRDPYSLEAATDRQASYAGRLGSGSFTPQLVVEGRTSLIGSRDTAVRSAIAAAREAMAGGASVDLRRAAGGVVAAIGAGQGAGRVLLVGFDRQRTTAVGRGENGGRTLTESNIVRSVRTIGQWAGAPLRLNATLDAGEDAAILVQAPDGRILGAGRLGGASS